MRSLLRGIWARGAPGGLQDGSDARCCPTAPSPSHFVCEGGVVPRGAVTALPWGQLCPALAVVRCEDGHRSPSGHPVGATTSPQSPSRWSRWLWEMHQGKPVPPGAGIATSC